MTDGARPGLPGLDQQAVGAWMAEHVAGLVPPMTFTLIAGGHSNLTYAARDAAGRDFVVRRGPLGKGAGGAHDMGREHRVIAALAGTTPVPTALGLCEDETVNGVPFYVMARVEGAVIDNPAAADTHLPDPGARRRAGEQVIDVLADLHRADVDAIGLGTAARREGFLDRQITRFADLWERTATRPLPTIEGMAGDLRARAPVQTHVSVVHGDYRIGNVMLDATGTLAAVLDWELWTLGDPLADLAFLLNNWYEPDDPAPLVFIEVPPTITGEYGTRDAVIARYAARTGFDVAAIDYYRAFQHWRMAVLAEGVKRRYDLAEMASDDVDHAHLDRRVVDLVDLARASLARFAAR